MKFNFASPHSQQIATVMSQTNQVRTYYFSLTLTISFQSCFYLLSDIRTNNLYVFIMDLTQWDQ